MFSLSHHFNRSPSHPCSHPLLIRDGLFLEDLRIDSDPTPVASSASSACSSPSSSRRSPSHSSSSQSLREQSEFTSDFSDLSPGRASSRSGSGLSLGLRSGSEGNLSGKGTILEVLGSPSLDDDHKEPLSPIAPTTRHAPSSSSFSSPDSSFSATSPFHISSYSSSASSSPQEPSNRTSTHSLSASSSLHSRGLADSAPGSTDELNDSHDSNSSLLLASEPPAWDPWDCAVTSTPWVSQKERHAIRKKQETHGPIEANTNIDSNYDPFKAQKDKEKLAGMPRPMSFRLAPSSRAAQPGAPLPKSSARARTGNASQEPEETPAEEEDMCDDYQYGDEDSDDEDSAARLARGIFVGATFFNHSCNPNVEWYGLITLTALITHLLQLLIPNSIDMPNRVIYIYIYIYIGILNNVSGIRYRLSCGPLRTCAKTNSCVYLIWMMMIMTQSRPGGNI